MITIVFLMLSTIFLSPSVQINESVIPSIELEDGSHKICIVTFGRQVICIVVQSELKLGEELMVEGVHDSRANTLTLDFGQKLTGSLKIMEDTQLKLGDDIGTLKAGTSIDIKDGIAILTPFDK